MTKTLNQIIFIFLHQNQNIFFSNIGNQNIFLEKNHNPTNSRTCIGVLDGTGCIVLFKNIFMELTET
jgi:hypothetical protein